MNTDVQQMELVKEEPPEEQSASVDLQDPDLLHIKEEREELETSLRGEQLQLKEEETDATWLPFTTASIKSEDDEEKPLFSHLHRQQIEDRDAPTSSSVNKMTAETSRNSDLNHHQQTSEVRTNVVPTMDIRSFLQRKNSDESIRHGTNQQLRNHVLTRLKFFQQVHIEDESIEIKEERTHQTTPSKRKRSESEVDSQDDDSHSQHNVAAGQSETQAYECSSDGAEVSTTTVEYANGTSADKNNDFEQQWPECWSQAQIHYFSTTYRWLISKNKKLGCNTCSHINARMDTQQGQRVSVEWSRCLVSSFGKDKAAQNNSLRKKIKEHKDSNYHKKAVAIKERAADNTMEKHTEEMQKADYDSTCNVFRTAYKIGKHGRPFTDMPVDVQLQVLNGVNMGRVLHSDNACANILDHIAAEMKEKIVNDIVMNRRKLCVLVDESATISGTPVLVVCLRSAIAGKEPDTIFFELIELQGTSAKEITDALLECLQKNGFDPHFLQDHLLAFACNGASVMLGRKAGVAAQLCCTFPNLFVWHCSNHRLELAVCDVLEEVGEINHFENFLDQLYSLYHASPKNQRELTESAHSVGQRLLVIGRALSVRWVASSERTVKAVWENYQALQMHFTSAAADTNRDSCERAKYKELNDVLTSVSFVANLSVMYDALTELSDLSRMLQRQDVTLDQADRLLARQIRVFESMASTPGPQTQVAIEAEETKIFRNVKLHENQRVPKINPAQFFRSLAANVECRMTPTTSSHVSRTSSVKTDSLLKDIQVLQSDSWPATPDIQYGDAEVRRLCERFKIEERESVLGFREYKDLKGSKIPAALKPLLEAVHTIAVSTSECERAFSSMNDTLTDERNSLHIKSLSNLIFLKCNGPPLDQFNAQSYVRSWLATGRRSATCTSCEAPSANKVDPKACWSLF